MKPNSIVVFDPKVFMEPYAPWYDFYKGHTFQIVGFHYGNTHVEVTCVSDPAIVVKGYVHPDELILYANETLS